MNLSLEPGTYVVAVSGGVDSVALLDMLVRRPELKLVVAHLDHGIRSDSELDRRLVQDMADKHRLPFVYDEARLGPGASEDEARKARYGFLRHVQRASGARAIVTAHHQDDLLETAILNMLRGTGRRGLASLRSYEDLERPLLHIPKADLIAYAKDQGLVWREDSTNADMRYFRNYVRHKILPRFSPAQKQELLQHIRKIMGLHEELETTLTDHLHMHPGISQLDRHWFVMLPHAVAREVLAAWLRRHEVKDISSKSLERLVTQAKTYRPGQMADVDKRYVLHIKPGLLALEPRDC